MNDDREDTGILGAIRGILDALSDAEREGRSGFDDTGRLPDGHFTTEYSFTGRIGPQESPFRSESPRSHSRPTSDSAEAGEGSYRVAVRHGEDDDEFVVVADLPDVDEEDLTVGVDTRQNELVIGVSGRTVERLELPWPVAEADSRFHHDVLELRFTPAGAEP